MTWGVELPPAEVILHLVTRDIASGPVPWVKNAIEHKFPVSNGDLVTGFTVINHGDPSKTPIYHSNDYKMMTKKNRSYTVFLSIDIIPESPGIP